MHQRPIPLTPTSPHTTHLSHTTTSFIRTTLGGRSGRTEDFPSHDRVCGISHHHRGTETRARSTRTTLLRRSTVTVTTVRRQQGGGRRVVEERKREGGIEGGDRVFRNGWVEVGVECSKRYATERMACDRQEKQSSKQTNKQT